MLRIALTCCVSFALVVRTGSFAPRPVLPRVPPRRSSCRSAARAGGVPDRDPCRAVPHRGGRTGDRVRPGRLSAARSGEDGGDQSPAAAAAAATDAGASVLGKLKARSSSNNEADGLTTKERLAKMGLSAFLSYGWVSNMSYAVALSLSWYGFTAKTGLSPLAPGQWKPFLAVYAGFYVFNNIVRPVRFAASVVVAKYFEDFIGFVGRRTKLSRKWSIAVVVFLVNVCGTFAAMGLGVTIASAASGVPIFPAKA